MTELREKIRTAILDALAAGGGAGDAADAILALEIAKQIRIAALNEARDAIGSQRQLEAADWTSPKCMGQRGHDRSTAFYDATEIVRHLIALPSAQVT